MKGNIPGEGSENVPVFFGFCRKLVRMKTNKSTYKESEHNIQYYCAYQQVMSTLSFILYPLFILFPHYFWQLPFFHPPLLPLEYSDPPVRAGIGNVYTALPPTSYKPLPPPSLSTYHRASVEASVVAPAADSNEYLPTLQPRKFVAASAVNDNHKLWPIWCCLCYFVLTYPSYHSLLCEIPPYPPLNPSLTIAPNYVSSEYMAMRIWKENQRKIRRNQIRISGLTLIWSLIIIQFHRLPPSPPLLVVNPVGGGCQHPQLGTSSSLFHRHRDLLVHPLCPLQKFRWYWTR